MKVRKAKLAAIRKSYRAESGCWVLVSSYTSKDAKFAASLIKKTPVTAEVVATAKDRADRTKAARNAGFLDKYRLKAA
jgi:hypothetical protein